MLERDSPPKTPVQDPADFARAEMAFFLTGRHPGTELESVEGRDLRPALLAGYRDLAALRYDYPLVLVEGRSGAEAVRPLSAIIDEALASVARGDDADRITQHVLRLEKAMRASMAQAPGRRLGDLWEMAAGELGHESDKALADSLQRARSAIQLDGTVADCDADLPGRVVGHLWQTVQEGKAARLKKDIARLIHKVGEILCADLAHSERGRTAETLRASLGGLDADAFDFDALSRVLVRTANRTTLTETRRQRLRQITEALEAWRFDPEAFRFDSCRRALDAWRDRYRMLADVARAIAMADLEIAGDYREARHDAFFEDYGGDGLSPEDLSLFPDTLVCVNAAAMDPEEQAALMEILSSGLPMKVLVQTDDLLGNVFPGSGPAGFGRSAPHFAQMAVGLNDVFVLQVAASHLPACRNQLSEGMAYPGTTLFSVFSGCSGTGAPYPPYLVAAAAADSRAFPVFAYNPSAGEPWARRFSLAGNAQPDSDWPVSEFCYEDGERSRVSEELAFTFVDFAAMDERYTRHFAAIPDERWETGIMPVAKAIADPVQGEPGRLPAILMVDADDRLHKVLVDEKLLREAGRCQAAWHGLQEQAAARYTSAQEPAAEAPDGEAIPESETDEASESTPTEAEAGTASAEPAETPSPNDPYIETPRCTTCNECTQINEAMFAYNENRQAYIADPDAGTYAQLVEAAESCQVSIIHPGKPRNPDEPGLEALLERAQPFL